VLPSRYTCAGLNRPEGVVDLESELAFLRDKELDVELKKSMLDKIFQERKDARDLALERKKFWHNTPLVVALVGTITIGANLLSSFVLNTQTSQTDASKDERQFAFGVINQELAKSTDLRARAEVLLFLVRAGVLNSLNRDELEKMATADLQRLNIPPESVGIPPTVGSLSAPPDYSLPTPEKSSEQTDAATRLLVAAIGEINKDVEENISFDIVKTYWSAVESPSITPDPSVPWSGAFLAWLISQAGNPNKLPMTASNIAIWNAGVKKGLTFLPGEEKVLPGDLFFISRSVSDVEVLRSGNAASSPAHSGVVYSVNGDVFATIEGNIGNAIRQRETSITDAKLIGFLRIHDEAG
jgi:hypothetical protein